MMLPSEVWRAERIEPGKLSKAAAAASMSSGSTLRTALSEPMPSMIDRISPIVSWTNW